MIIIDIINKIRGLFLKKQLQNNEIISSVNQVELQIQSLNNRIQLIDCELKTIEDGINSIEKIINKKLSYVNPELFLMAKKDKKLNILLCGFYGAPNLGDELMLQTLLSHLNNSNYSITIMVANNINYNICNMIDMDVHFLHMPQSIYDLNIIADNFDILLFGGGAIIDDLPFNKLWDMELSLSTVLIELSIYFIKKKKKVYWFGLSCNKSLSNKEFISKLKYISTYIPFFSVRDDYSFKILQKNKLCMNNIVVNHDIILGNQILSKKLFIQPQNKIGVILISNEKYEKNELLLINRLLSFIVQNKLNFRVILIPFYDYNNNDTLFYSSLLKQVNKPEIVDIVDYKNNFNDIKIEFLQCWSIISMRYHGSLLAMALNKPLLSILINDHPHYYNKMKYIHEKYNNINNLLNFEKLNITKKLNIHFKRITNINKNELFDQTIFKQAYEQLETINKKITNCTVNVKKNRGI